MVFDSATLWAIALQAPCPWDFPGKDTGVDCYSLLQGMFPTQGSNLCLLHQQTDSLLSDPPGKSMSSYTWNRDTHTHTHTHTHSISAKALADIACLLLKRPH